MKNKKTLFGQLSLNKKFYFLVILLLGYIALLLPVINQYGQFVDKTNSSFFHVNFPYIKDIIKAKALYSRMFMEIQGLIAYDDMGEKGEFEAAYNEFEKILSRLKTQNPAKMYVHEVKRLAVALKKKKTEIVQLLQRKKSLLIKIDLKKNKIIEQLRTDTSVDKAFLYQLVSVFALDMEYLEAEDEADIRKVTEEIGPFDHLMESLQDHRMSGELKDLIKEYTYLYSSAVEVLTALQKITKEIEAYEDRVFPAIDELIYYENVRIEEYLLLMRKNIRNASFVVMILSVGLLIIILLVVFNAIRRIVVSINDLLVSLQRVAFGDLEHTVHMPGDYDIGRVASAVNVMRIRLRESYHKMSLAKEKAEEANRAKGILLANVSHELRTPLTAILGFAEMAKMKSKDTDDVDKIAREANVLLELIDSLLDLTRIEVGRYELHERVYDLHVLIKETFSSYAYLADQKNLAYQVSISGGVPKRVHSDQMVIRQVMNNFLSNAIKYTPKGSVQLNVSAVSKHDSKVTVRFEVKDTGIGIPAEMKEQIFEEFRQLDEGDTRKYGGLGIGLALVRHIVDMLGGIYGVESEERGKGSCFWCEIPLEVASKEQVEVNAGQPSSKDQIVTPSLPDPDKIFQVLIAEDYGPTREVLKSLLESYGCQTTFVLNGEDAVMQCSKEHFDFILMDVQMPRMDGFEATQEIRKISDHYAQVAIIAITATQGKDIKFKCHKAGMNGMLTKPFGGKDIISCLNTYLGTHFPLETTQMEQEMGDSENPIFSFDRLLQSFAGNKQSAMRAFDAFIKVVSSQIITIGKAIERADYDRVAKEAHKISGGAATLSMKEVTELAKQLEEFAEKEDMEGIKAKNLALQEAISSVIECVKNKE